LSYIIRIFNPQCPKCLLEADTEPEHFYGFCQSCDYTFCTNCLKDYHGFDGGCLDLDFEILGTTLAEVQLDAQLPEILQGGALESSNTKEEFECKICITKFELAFGIVFGCGHKYCAACVKDYFEGKIKENLSYGYKCPNPECEAEAGFELIKEIISLELFEKYDELLFSEAIRDMPEIVSKLNWIIIFTDIPICFLDEKFS